jgi:hypothetical protein
MTGLAERIGRRGATLLFLAVLDVLYGYSQLATEAPARAFDLLLPWEVWGWIWIGAGLFIATGIFARQDWPQFTVAAGLKLCWGLLFIRVWLIDDVARGWVSVVIWLCFALFVVVVAGWPEPHHGEDLPEITTP